MSPSLLSSRLQQFSLGLGGSWFVPYSEPGDEDANLLDAMGTAYDFGVRHFDTAAGYGNGHSEELYGRFILGRRDQVFLASKSDPAEGTAASMLAAVEGSLKRLKVDFIDLYYAHWPHTGWDMRKVLEGLERARSQGKIGAVGVSNFSVTTMQEVQQVARIDAHQLGYNLLWRYAEDDVIPFCRANDIAVVAYSSLAHGILTGKFGRMLDFAARDQRNSILPFRADIWPSVHAGVEQLKAIAAEVGRPLSHLAIRWILQQPGITSALIGARNKQQAEANAGALAGELPPEVFERMTAISDEIARHMPSEGNLFNYYP